MDAIVPALLVSTVFASGMYFGLCFGAATGLPPILVLPENKEAQDNRQREMFKTFLPMGYALMISLAMIALAVVINVRWLLGISLTCTSASLIALGLQVRTFARKNHIPSDATAFRWPFFVSPFSRWPMLGFDIWTIGFSVILWLITFTSLS